MITLATQHYSMLARNLLYTAVTRGKRLVIVVGQRRSVTGRAPAHGPAALDP